MGAKPAFLPRWADVGGAIIAPAVGKLDVGWVTAERPPAQYLNWWQNLVYTWILFVNSFFTVAGGAKAQIDVGNVAEATTTPLVTFRDYNQKVRTVIDHNGYRMGQVSEVDETWLAGNTAATFDLPIEAAIIAGGTPTWSSAGGWTFGATTHLIDIPVGGAVPVGATITGLTVFYNPATSTDSLGATLFLDQSSGGTSKDSSTHTSGGTGNTSFDYFSVAPTTGYPRATVSASSRMILQLNPTTITSSVFVQRVVTTAVVDPPGWSYVGATTDTVPTIPTAARVADNRAYLDPDANVNQRTVQLLGQGLTAPSVASSSVLTPTKYETYHDANCAYVIEFMLRTGTITDASNKRILAAGIQNNNAGAGNRFVYVYNQDTTANWQLRIVGSATTDTDLGVAVAANTTYRVRLEIYGASANSSGITLIRVFINGILRSAQNTSALPTADMIRPYFKVGSSTAAAAGPYDMRIGRVRRAWNHLLTQDNL